MTAEDVHTEGKSRSVPTVHTSDPADSVKAHSQSRLFSTLLGSRIDGREAEVSMLETKLQYHQSLGVFGLLERMLLRSYVTPDSDAN